MLLYMYNWYEGRRDAAVGTGKKMQIFFFLLLEKYIEYDWSLSVWRQMS